MAAVGVTLSGLLYDLLNRTTQRVVIIADASLTGVGIGGGPVIPPDQPPSQPPGIWGPPGPWPTPPIAFPPGWVGGVPPGGGPPGIWGPPGPWPSPPISFPPGWVGGVPPDKPPEPVSPPIDWKVVWTPSDGWVVVGIPNVPHPVPSSGTTSAPPPKK